MAPNIYDNADFFARYSQMDRSRHGLAGAPEWPALRAILPDLHGSILDLGCGFGWFSRWAREHGAHSVLGIDLSENMLDRATQTTSDPEIRYQKGDLNTIELPESSFELAFSSLTIHYVQNLSRLFLLIHRALIPGGRFVFSTEHPIYTAPRRPEWIVDTAGHRTWPVDQYLLEGPRVTNWLIDGVVKQHRTIGSIVALLIRSGFSLKHLEEWGPSDDQLTVHPEWSEHRDRPMFLLISAQK